MSTVFGRMAASVGPAGAGDAANALHAARTALNRARAVADWLPDSTNVDALQHTLSPLGFSALPVDVLHETAAGAAQELANVQATMQSTEALTSGVPLVLARASADLERAVALTRATQPPFAQAARPAGVTLDVTKVRGALDSAGATLDELFGSAPLLAGKTALDRARGVAHAMPPTVDAAALQPALTSLGFHADRPLETIRADVALAREQMWNGVDAGTRAGTVDDLAIAVVNDADAHLLAAGDASASVATMGDALDRASLSYGLLVRGNRI